MLLCLSVVVAFSASLEVIVHAQYLVWGLVSSWFDYCGLLLNTKFEFVVKLYLYTSIFSSPYL